MGAISDSQNYNLTSSLTEPCPLGVTHDQVVKRRRISSADLMEIARREYRHEYFEKNKTADVFIMDVTCESAAVANKPLGNLNPSPAAAPVFETAPKSEAIIKTECHGSEKKPLGSILERAKLMMMKSTEIDAESEKIVRLEKSSESERAKEFVGQKEFVEQKELEAGNSTHNVLRGNKSTTSTGLSSAFESLTGCAKNEYILKFHPQRKCEHVGLRHDVAHEVSEFIESKMMHECPNGCLFLLCDMGRDKAAESRWIIKTKANCVKYNLFPVVLKTKFDPAPYSYILGSKDTSDPTAQLINEYRTSYTFDDFAIVEKRTGLYTIDATKPLDEDNAAKIAAEAHKYFSKPENKDVTKILVKHTPSMSGYLTDYEWEFVIATPELTDKKTRITTNVPVFRLVALGLISDDSIVDKTDKTDKTERSESKDETMFATKDPVAEPKTQQHQPQDWNAKLFISLFNMGGGQFANREFLEAKYPSLKGLTIDMMHTVTWRGQQFVLEHNTAYQWIDADTNELITVQFTKQQTVQ